MPEKHRELVKFSWNWVLGRDETSADRRHLPGSYRVDHG